MRNVYVCVRVQAGCMDTKLTRDERRRQKDLEEARKLGNAPAEVDEEGKYGCVVFVESNFINSC